MTYTERLVTARKRHQCEDYPPTTHTIKPGEQYVIATEYPGGESGYADDAGHPVRIKLCTACAGPRRMERLIAEAGGKFAPTHRVRERDGGEWTEVRADGVEPQTYYDAKGETIYAGIWWPHMEVERLIASEPSDSPCSEHHSPGYACQNCGVVKPRAFWLDGSASHDSRTAP